VKVRERPDFSYDDELSTERWIEIVKEACEMGVKEWLIGGGGEPLIRADAVLAMVRTIKNYDPESVIEISTNGTYLTQEMAEELVRLKCDFIQVGIDGHTEEIHDFLRGKKNAFKNTTNGIRYLSYAKNKLRSKKPFIKVHVVLNSKNYLHLPDLFLLAKSLGANHFAVAAMRVDDGNRDMVESAGLRLNLKQKKEVHKIWKKVEEIAKDSDVMLGPAFYEGMEEVSTVVEYEKPKTIFEDKNINNFLSAFCFAPFYSLIVDWAGNVGPCACAGSVRIVDKSLNNLGKKSLKEVWYGNFLNSARKCVKEGRPLDLREYFTLPDNTIPEGSPVNPCKTCGINVERKELLEWLPNLLKSVDCKK
jgi:MoaA/NifB/PqqE/SkfB family radical SAM enzyme